MKKRGFTLIELLVVIAIIAILAAILFPVFAQARDKARATTCLSSTKQIALSVHMYAQDFDEAYPMVWPRSAAPAVLWPDVLMPYVKNQGVWKCPSRLRARPLYTTYGVTFGMNSHAFGYNNPAQIIKMGQINYPSELAFCMEVADARDREPWLTLTDCSQVAFDYLANPHQDGLNVAYSDGHAKWSRKTPLCAEGKNGNTSRFWWYAAP
jgi:prepilin-type N-terminal cleavage/methylation domain-containing protein/prepilin-type processing-associated H-X9-DG protein